MIAIWIVIALFAAGDAAVESTESTTAPTATSATATAAPDTARQVAP